MPPFDHARVQQIHRNAKEQSASVTRCLLSHSIKLFIFFLSGQTEGKTETETVLALALEIERQIYPSFLHSLLSLSLSPPFKRLEVHPNWVLNAN